MHTNKVITVQDCIRNAERGKFAIISNGTVEGFTKLTFTERLAAIFGRRSYAD